MLPSLVSLLGKPELEEALFQRTPNKLQTELDGEMIILDLVSNNYSGLNEIGVLIWGCLEEPATFKTIRAKILAEYNIEEKQSSIDLAKFIEKMIDNQLIKKII